MEEADLQAYLLSDDAARAEHWQLVCLAACRRELGRPMPQAAYEAMREVLAGFAAETATLAG